ncbi:MAG: rod shape-determining protein MreC [Limnochordaceae bacterium]|nr:rod shape-determining protein MreC [Limnochordaceae bacterium]
MRPRGEGRPPTERRARGLWTLAWVAGAVVLVSLAYVTAQVRPERSAPERWMADVLAVPKGWVAQVAQGMSRAMENLARLASLQRAYRDLEEENRALRLQLSLLSGVEAENRELRRQLGLPELGGMRLLAADVIDRQPSRWYAQIVINRGSADGVAPQMAAVAAGGVIGQVQSVTARTATVTLISDPRMALGGLVVRTGDLVLVEGTGSGSMLLKVRSLTPDASFESGDRIVASGLGGVYPKGVAVAVLKEVRRSPDRIGLEGWAVATANLHRIPYAYVIMPGPGREQAP